MSEIPRSKNDTELRDVEKTTHEALGEWAKGHLNDLITMLEYNPQYYPFQRLDMAHFGPIDPSPEPIEGGRVIMGGAFDELVDALRAHVPGIKERLSRGVTTMVVTPHLQNVLDTPIVEAALSSAYGDESLADDSIILTGKVISRLAIFGVPAVEIMARMGRVYMSVPRSPSAREAGVTDETIDYINRRMLGELLREVRHGKVVHHAPSNGRARRQEGPDGSTILTIPRADDTTTKLITKYYSYAIPVAIRIGNDLEGPDWVIGSPNYVREPADLHRMMEELAFSANGLFKNGEVVYGGQAENDSI